MTKSENQLRQVVADMQNRINMQQEEISSLRGTIEESEYRLNNKIDKVDKERAADYEITKGRIEILENYQKNQNEINKRVVEAIMKNEELIIKVDQNFKDFRKTKMNKNVKKDLKYATKLYEQKKYKESREIYLEYLDQPHLLKEKEFRVILYRVGLMEYRMEMNDESIAHFSQLYQKFYKEDDKYMASALFHIGSLLLKDNKCSEAKEVYEQIKSEYSEHKYFNKMSDKKLKEILHNPSCSIAVY